MSTEGGSLPFDSWAEHYEPVMERTFGALYDRLTSCALAEIEARLRPGAGVVDFGAGCGRLSLPLAASGYRVCAVEPSGPMLDEVRRRARLEGVEVETGLAEHDPSPGSIRAIQSTLQAYAGTYRYDMALCVFTVIAYMRDESELDAGFAAAARALVPGGLFLLDVPSQDVFTGFDHETADVIRSVDIEPIGDSLYSYRESTTVRTADGQASYRDNFVIRRWDSHTVRAALGRAGFQEEADVSARFEGLGAEYLLYRSEGS